VSNKERYIASKEAKFDLHELFFSITERDSTIVSGNSTFVRISGYTRTEILGQFHNIIRHPDMPRIIFKTLWDYLKAGKPIATYVKNMTKNGEYYWVFAVVFPLNDRYVSIRIKPNTSIFEAVREVYFKLLMTENSKNMQESNEFLTELLRGLGYRDYDHFMYDALLSELLKRKELLSTSKIKEDFSCSTQEPKLKIQSIYCSCKTLLEQYGKWFEKIHTFNKVKEIFEEKALTLSSLARDIVFLSFNASVASYRVDTNGETFGVLASDIRTNAKENDALISQIHTISNSLSNSLHKIIFFVSSISLQVEMVTYFVKELFQETDEALDNDIFILFQLIKLYNDQLMELPLLIDKAIQQNLNSLDELEQQIMYLGYVQIYGIIESARSNDDFSGFNEIFSQLKVLITNTSEEIILMKKIGEGFFRDNRILINESKNIEKILDKLEDEISDMKNIEG